MNKRELEKGKKRVKNCYHCCKNLDLGESGYSWVSKTKEKNKTARGKKNITKTMFQ